MEEIVLTDEEIKAVETPEADQGIDNLNKTLADMSELKASQVDLTSKMNTLVDAVTALANKAAEEDKKEEPKKPATEEKKPEEEKKKEIEPKAVEIPEDVIQKAIDTRLAEAGIKIPAATPKDKSSTGSGITGHWDIIKKAVFDENMTVEDIELRRKF